MGTLATKKQKSMKGWIRKFQEKETFADTSFSERYRHSGSQS